MSQMRPTFVDLYMTLAQALAQRSTCLGQRVGTVITSVDFRKVLAIGYTGNASGLPNQCDRPGPDCGCLHAEENAVIHCDAARSEPKIVVTSQPPCRQCAKRLINLGGVADVYTPAPLAGEPAHDPNDTDGDVGELLASVGIRLHQLKG